MRSRLSVLALVLAAAPAVADGPKDNVPDNVRPVPPKGVPVPDADKARLKEGMAKLIVALDAVKTHELAPDVEVYLKAAQFALENDEFFTPKEVAVAQAHLETGLKRAEELKAGKPSWPTRTGPVVRGYRSKIDGSVQPYGIVVPKAFADDPKAARRLDFWWHGRGETLSEVNFIADREKNPGQFTPPDTFVLHPYGRYCNANKFAGEVDTFECLEHAKKHYPIDDNRVAARGFSMGGAACWQFAVHYPTLWAAAAPGAGFAETPEFLNVFQNEKVEPAWYEQKLWRMYNATDYAQNLFNLPTIAYSGEIDKQKQAADVMAREMKKVGLELNHIIGPKTAHAYEPKAKKELEEKFDALMAKGRPASPRPEVKFVTYTLRYNQCDWVEVTGLEKHWDKATVAGKFADGIYELTTTGVTSLSVTAKGPGVTVRIDGQTPYERFGAAGDQPTAIRFRKTGGTWRTVLGAPPPTLAKTPGLQGPIDDAFFDRFVMVRPTGKPLTEATGKWVPAEMLHAVAHWRKHFRGDAPQAADTDLTDEQIKTANLVLWGDPQSNAVLAKIADKLPVKWTKDGLELGGQKYDAGSHVPVLIFPNPLNPAKYVVLNSGFTFREYDYLNNARQVPKLPDYAILDVSAPPTSRAPGKVVRAGFFGEKWELPPNDGQ